MLYKAGHFVVVYKKFIISSCFGRGLKMGINAEIGLVYLVVTIVSFTVAAMMMKKGL
jgi:hypothetical protein